MGARLLPLTDLPHLRIYRLGTAAALIAAPLFFLADNLLHPKEFEHGNEVEQLSAIADAYTRWQAAHALGFAAILLFAAAALGLAFLVRRRQPTLGLVGGALAVAGLLGLAAVLTIDGYSWAIVGEASRRPEVGEEAAAAVLEDLQSSGWSYLYYLTPLGFIIGVVVLAIGALRQGAVPAWAGWLLALAALMVGTETTIVSNAYFIAGAAVFLVAATGCALAILGMSDEEFAGGTTAGRSG
jgi:Domain of unknown function (DUF4386)